MWEREKERFVIRLVFVLTHHTCIDGDSLLDWQLLLPRFLFFYLRRNIRRKMTFKNRVAFNLFRRDAKIREYTTLAAFKYAFDVSCWPCWERSGRLSYPCRIMLRPSFILHLPVLGVHVLGVVRACGLAAPVRVTQVNRQSTDADTFTQAAPLPTSHAPRESLYCKYT